MVFKLKKIFGVNSKKFNLASSNDQPFTLPDEIFILFDFSCGRFYTHHSSYLKDYYDFLVARNKLPFIWVNTSAGETLLEFFDYNAKAILRSNQYSHTRQDNFKRFAIDYLVNASAKLKIAKFVSFLLAPYYLQSAVKEFRALLKLQLPIKFIVPTLDGLGLRFLVKILKSYADKISLISIRVIGAERRGVFGFDNSLEILKELTLFYPNKIHIGFEVKAFETLLIRNDILPKNIFWAPMPYIARQDCVDDVQIDDVRPLKIGFLGSARPNKGFDSIPELLNELEIHNVDFVAFIQLPNFKWNYYDITLNKLKEKHGKSIQFISPGIDKSLLNKTIGFMDFIVLPYRLDTYKIAGSGIMFIACDYGVPLAATQDLGLTWDIEQFKIGFSFASAHEFSSKMRLFKSSQFYSGISIYNEARTRANLVFLDLG